MVFSNNLLMGAAGQGGAVYEIDQSIRFNDNDAAYLYRDNASAQTNTKKFTYSLWIKRGAITGGTNTGLLSGGSGTTSGRSDFIFTAGGATGDSTNDALKFDIYTGGWTQRRTTSLLRDPSAWYHIVLVYDAANSTANDTLIIYQNGTRLTLDSTSGVPNNLSLINANGQRTRIGADASNTPVEFDGYMAEINMIDGQALDPTSFGEYNADDVWIPKAYDGSYGSNGFYITGEDSTFLGQDVRTSGDQVNSFQAAQWTGATGSYTFTDGGIEADASNKAIKTVDTFTGDFEFSWRYVNMANFIFGLYEIDEDGTFSDSSSAGNMQNMTDSWYVQTSSVAANRDIYYGGAVQVNATTIANGDTWKMTRESGEIKVYRNDSLVHTFTQTSTNEVRLVVAQGDAAADANQVNWVDNSTLGNNFFSSGLTTADQMSDTPTLNYCVMNILDNGRPGNITVSDGNLTAAFAGAGYQGGIRSSFFFDSEDSEGWYAECTLDSLAFASIFRAGVANAAIDLSSTDAQSNANAWAYSDQGAKLNNSYTTGYGSSVGVGDVVGIAVRNGKIYFAVNNTWQGSADPVTESNPAFSNLVGDVAFCQSTSTGGSYAHTATWNFGQSGFTYTPPTGYKAVNTANLDTPSITDGSKYFNTVLYEGNGGGQRVGQFQPITETYTVPNSVIFNDNDSASLTRTPSSAGNRRTFTFSCWVKRANLTGANQPIFTASGSSWIMFLSGETLGINFDSSGNYRIVTNQVFKDTSSWFHVVLRVDTTNATADDRLRMYINGSQVTDFGTRTNPPLNADTDWNNTGEHRIGKLVGASQYFDGYLAEINHIDGQSLGPDSFGQLDASTNKWIPKDASGLTFGTNGFYLDMETAPGTGSGAGTDSSGNGNNWTESGLAAADQVDDSPTDNQSVLDANRIDAYTLSQGNLFTNAVGDAAAIGTIPFDPQDEGGFYFEAKVKTAATYPNVGIRTLADIPTGSGMSDNTTGRYAYTGSNGQFNDEGTGVSYGDVWAGTADKVIGVYIKAGELFFSVDGTIQNSGTPAKTGLTGLMVPTVFYDAGSGTHASWEMRFNSSEWSTTPSGYKSISTDNLPLSNGDLSAFVWIKNRDAADNHMLFDAVRGATKDVHSNASDVEVTNANTLTRFLKNGFEVSNDAEVNTSGESYVAWQWLNDSLTTSSNTDGDITSTVLANTTTGFSIVKYSGNGSDNQEIGHGIGLAPKMIISKRLDASGNWTTYHDAVGINQVFYLNSTAAPASNTEQYRAVPTSSVYTVGVGGDINNASGTYVAYCFAEIPGYSSIGTYTGNGSTDGTFVYTGFKPVFVILKRTNATQEWQMYDTERDPFNVSNHKLEPNSNSAESVLTTDNNLDFLSNGFKLRQANGGMNASGSTYIYMAFAENPFGGDGVAPATAR